MATAIDTLKIYERLKSADLSDKAAKEIAEVVRESSELSSTTKETMREELSKEFVTKTDSLAAKAEQKTEISEVKSEILKVKSELKAEISEVKAELKSEISKVRTELLDTKAELLKWMFIFWASQIGIIVALIKFLK
ncbi:hypothetical protein [Candidatus Magnetomonas plexicatena]|uniref:hypothetical protein n=1 Tax=Candidatus Magnetomonas plexicatena TaxID=2552947 RepID=UPI001C7945B6|nr:DUF1640 domain-containing protein [Nitrospirales bacterium LBB_01]